MPELNGFIIINKPKNWTSFDVVAKLRSVSGVKDIGHSGTLDPFATGVLVVAVGKARFLFDLVQTFEKVYQGRLRLGQTSDTDDIDGKKSEIKTGVKPTEKDIHLVLAKYKGKIEQIPPDYSALKVKGRKMYELARKGLPVKKNVRMVEIHELKLLAYRYPHLDIEASVGKGTYIRALARDIGKDLKIGAFLEELVRHRVGPFNLDEAHEIGDTTTKNLPDRLVPIESVINEELKVILSDSEAERLAHGESVKAPNKISNLPDQPFIAVVDTKDKLLLVAEYDSKRQTLKSKKIFDESLRR